MANNVSPAYASNPLDNFLQLFFEAGVSETSSSASSAYEEPLSPFDIYEGPSRPTRAASAPAAQKSGRGSATAKYVWRRITGGRQRHEAKARLLTLQAELIDMSHTMQQHREEYAGQEALYVPLRKQHTLLRNQACFTLDARHRTISLMHTFQTYDKRLHDSFLDLDAVYRLAYPELLELQAALHDHRAGMKRVIATMEGVRTQALGMLSNLAQLQEVYMGYYGRLPHAVRHVSSLSASFGVPVLEPAVESLPAPDTLEKMPWHFQPPPPPKPKNTRKQPPPCSKPQPQAAPPRPPAYLLAEDQVAEGAVVADRIAPVLEKIFAGDPTGWNNITQEDLDAIELALRHSTLRVDLVDSATVSVRQHVAYKVLGDPEATGIRLRYRKRQMVVHPDKTGNLPKDARAKADTLCKILSAALEELTRG